jgi:hypothetical protein
MPQHFTTRRPGILGPPTGRPSSDESLGGLLNTAALATAPIPGVGDVVGGAADLSNLIQDPSLANLGLLGAGLLPAVPAGAVGKQLLGAAREFTKKLTPAEIKFFREVFDNPSDSRELLEAVPNVRVVNGELIVPNEQALEGLTRYIDDTVVRHSPSDGPLPPGFFNDKFLKGIN